MSQHFCRIGRVDIGCPFLAIDRQPLTCDIVRKAYNRFAHVLFPQNQRHYFAGACVAPTRYSRMTSSFNSSSEVSATGLSKVIMPCCSRFTRVQVSSTCE